MVSFWFIPVAFVGGIVFWHFYATKVLGYVKSVI